ncbi:MAG TPA: hypothetical protein VMW75_04820, partial [Thermoanaerobaculia bacterium]|nr:hypothetical protein [Thermoanaerobaculia bacterium]
GPWRVSALDYNSYVLGASPANLGLTLDKTTGQNGDVIHLTIQANTANASLGNAEAFILLSEYGTAGTPQYQSNLAMAVVTN